MDDKDFELQWKDEQIAELRSALSGTITETGSYNPLEGKWEINTSSILTRLIQEAGRWCEYYASDLFVQWKYKIDQKLDNGTLYTDTFVFAFRDSGVDHEEFFSEREEMESRYNELFVYENYSLNPTAWENMNGEWKRLEGF